MLPVLLIVSCTSANPKHHGDEHSGDADTGVMGSEGGFEGSCGEVGTFDMMILGRAEDTQGNGVASASLRLVERNWSPGDYGAATTDETGRFEVMGSQLPYAEGCWGTGVQIWLEGETGALQGDHPLNRDLMKAISEGKIEIEMSSPIVLRDTIE